MGACSHCTQSAFACGLGSKISKSLRALHRSQSVVKLLPKYMMVRRATVHLSLIGSVTARMCWQRFCLLAGRGVLCGMRMYLRFGLNTRMRCGVCSWRALIQ